MMTSYNSVYALQGPAHMSVGHPMGSSHCGYHTCKVASLICKRCCELQHAAAGGWVAWLPKRRATIAESNSSESLCCMFDLQVLMEGPQWKCYKGALTHHALVSKHVFHAFVSHQTKLTQDDKLHLLRPQQQNALLCLACFHCLIASAGACGTCHRRRS